MSGTALVTGATGFVGGHLARSLALDGWEVHALLRPGRDAQALPEGVLPLWMPASARELARELQAVAPSAAFHLATLFRGRHTAQDVEPLVAANVLLGTQLAEALAERPPEVMLNVGTAWQRDEEGGYRPAALYAATKQAMEDILRYYAEAGAFPVVDVKLHDTYGPGDVRGKLLSGLDRASRTGEPLRMSPGEQLIDLLHVEDVVRALRRAASSADGPWTGYAAGSGHPRRVRELVALFAEATGRSVPVEWGAVGYRAREMFTPYQVGPPVPDWSPSIALEDGIRAVYGD